MAENIDPLNYLWDKANEAALRGDLAEVLTAWKELANSGVWSIYAKIGFLYERGAVGIAKDVMQALYWYKKAIFECDDPEAHVGLGRLYYQGDGVERNVIKACEHWKKAYAKSSHDAALYLGIAYSNGVGFSQDIQRAKIYLEEAAKSEYFFAYGKLARIAFDEKKFIKGITLLIKAYLLGRKIAKINPVDPRLLGIE